MTVLALIIALYIAYTITLSILKTLHKAQNTNDIEVLKSIRDNGITVETNGKTIVISSNMDLLTNSEEFEKALDLVHRLRDNER